MFQSVITHNSLMLWNGVVQYHTAPRHITQCDDATNHCSDNTCKTLDLRCPNNLSSTLLGYGRYHIHNTGISVFLIYVKHKQLMQVNVISSNSNLLLCHNLHLLLLLQYCTHSTLNTSELQQKPDFH